MNYDELKAKIGNSDTPFENGMRVNAFGMPVRITSEGQPCPVEW